MSEREQAKQIIDTLPDYKMQAILMFLHRIGNHYKSLL